MFNVIDGCIFFIICHDNEEKFTRNYNCLEVSSAFFLICRPLVDLLIQFTKYLISLCKIFEIVNKRKTVT